MSTTAATEQVKKTVSKPARTQENRLNTESKQKPVEIHQPIDLDTTIDVAREMVKNGASKADAAREVFDMLKSQPRKQVLRVFMEGVGLTKAGAGTYYYNIKKKALSR